jgi:hypothetical protein
MTDFAALPESLQAVRTRPLFVMRLEVGELQLIGKTRGGARRNLPGAGRQVRR